MTEEIRIQETTKPTISGYHVGVSNIWAREVPDADDFVAVRVTAMLTIMTSDLALLRRESVYDGSEFSLGADRYHVDHVEEGASEPGWITIHKVISSFKR